MCEALGAGLPTIYSSACNFPEVAQMGAGIEMSGFRVIDWCEALERVCLSPETQASMRDMARQNAEQYTWHNIAKTWAALYDKAAFNLQTMQG
jgi:glycosyltransferase involved in cell wall biosynthesis